MRLPLGSSGGHRNDVLLPERKRLLPLPQRVERLRLDQNRLPRMGMNPSILLLVRKPDVAFSLLLRFGK
jgi:hypothetical protein